MHQLQGLARAQGAQGFDQAVADAAAAVGGQAAGFVHGQQGLVLEHDAGGQAVQQALGHRPGLAGLVQLHGRDADLVAPGQAAVGLGPLAVDPDLAAAHELVDQAARGALELEQQEIVQALAVPVLGHLDHLHARGHFICRHGGSAYTIASRDNVLISLGVSAESRPPANPEEPLPHPTGVTMLAGAEGRRILPRTPGSANTGSRTARPGPLYRTKHNKRSRGYAQGNEALEVPARPGRALRPGSESSGADPGVPRGKSA